jgi:hypothetical protein
MDNDAAIFRRLYLIDLIDLALSGVISADSPAVSASNA